MKERTESALGRVLVTTQKKLPQAKATEGPAFKIGVFSYKPLRSTCAKAREYRAEGHDLAPPWGGPTTNK